LPWFGLDCTIVIKTFQKILRNDAKHHVVRIICSYQKRKIIALVVAIIVIAIIIAVVLVLVLRKSKEKEDEDKGKTGKTEFSIPPLPTGGKVFILS